jgi:hypothetical protein
MTEEDEIWEIICKAAAREASISIEKAKAILDDAGLTAYHHTGISPAIKVVVSEMKRGERWQN